MAEVVGLQEAEESEFFADAYVISAPCSVCGAEDVKVAPHYRFAARCASCLLAGVPPGGPVLPREPVVIKKAGFIVKRETVFFKPAAPPEPSVTSSDPWPEGVETPAPVLKLQRSAELLGWAGEVTYARGTPPRAKTEKESFALRLAKDQWRAVAVNTGGAWEYWGVAHMLRLPTQDAFTEYLTLVGTELIEPFVRRVRDEARSAAEKAAMTSRCADDGVHEAHDRDNGKCCPGRTKPKVKRAGSAGGKKESGG